LNFSNTLSTIKLEASKAMMEKQNEYNELNNKLKKCEVDKYKCTSGSTPTP